MHVTKPKNFNPNNLENNTNNTPNTYDVVVVGGGHAGVEAATASARMGCQTLLVTLSLDDIGQMSCNPAIGGIGKGHIVREIDALDGVMAKIIDKAGIQFRVLNQSKGPAVQGPRAQADRELYQQQSFELLNNYPNLFLKAGKVENILTNLDNHLASAVTETNTQPNYEERVETINDALPIVTHVVLETGEIIKTKAIVITTGTFLNGIIHVGNQQRAGGRFGSPPTTGISSFLQRYNFELSRLKTGTPARLKKESINWSVLEEQKGDAIPIPFSYLNTHITVPQISCYITYTNYKTHEIIHNNLSLSAVYNGNISSKGPRYCPSIEDKIVRFSSKMQHQIFLEPEGLNSDLVYPNGISTSLDEKVQLEFLRSMKGLENVEVARYGYAIEYDYVNPLQLKPTLETKQVANLFLAGQINGTTGYEEAGGQGLVAGINAGLRAQACENEFIIKRSEGYIGVMIDDLITQGVTEPYRMFTGRAEFRIVLRADNADMRLTQKGYDIGVVKSHRYNFFKQKLKSITNAKILLNNLIKTPSDLEKHGINISQDGIKRTALQLLGYNEITTTDLIKVWPELQEIPSDILQLIKIDSVYSKYIDKQNEEILQFNRDEEIKLGNNINYKEVAGLSAELVEKFEHFKPATLRTALSIRGATPSAGIAIFTYLKKQELLKRKN